MAYVYVHGVCAYIQYGLVEPTGNILTHPLGVIAIAGVPTDGVYMRDIDGVVDSAESAVSGDFHQPKELSDIDRPCAQIPRGSLRKCNKCMDGIVRVSG